MLSALGARHLLAPAASTDYSEAEALLPRSRAGVNELSSVHADSLVFGNKTPQNCDSHVEPKLKRFSQVRCAKLVDKTF